MTDERYQFLMNPDTPIKEAVLSAEEVAEGWHWCWDFDGLLVGPGMSELALCTCPPLRPKKETDNE